MFPSIERKEAVGEMVRMRGCNVDHIDVGVGDELFIAAVGGSGGRGLNLFDERARFISGGAGRDSLDVVTDIFNSTGGRVEEQIFGEDYGATLGKQLREMGNRKRYQKKSIHKLR